MSATIVCWLHLNKTYINASTRFVFWQVFSTYYRVSQVNIRCWLFKASCLSDDVID